MTSHLKSVLKRAVTFLVAAAPWSLALSSQALAGGEDFPFFCHITGSNTQEAFQVKSDLRSSTGYMLHYYERGRFVQSMPVWIDSTLDNKHTRLRASFRLGPLRDKHVIAFIGKTDQEFSSGATQAIRRGLAPVYKYRPLYCH